MGGPPLLFPTPCALPPWQSPLTCMHLIVHAGSGACGKACMKQGGASEGVAFGLRRRCPARAAAPRRWRPSAWTSPSARASSASTRCANTGWSACQYRLTALSRQWSSAGSCAPAALRHGRQAQVSASRMSTCQPGQAPSLKASMQATSVWCCMTRPQAFQRAPVPLLLQSDRAGSAGARGRQVDVSVRQAHLLQAYIQACINVASSVQLMLSWRIYFQWGNIGYQHRPARVSAEQLL